MAKDSNPAWVKIRKRRYSQLVGRDELFEKRYEAAAGAFATKRLPQPGNQKQQSQTYRYSNSSGPAPHSYR